MTKAPARTDHRFYTAMSIAVACTVFAGFGRTFYLKCLFPAPPLPWILHVHGALCTGWVLLYVTQNILIMQRRVGLHRRLGWAVAFLSLLVCIASVPVAIEWGVPYLLLSIAMAIFAARLAVWRALANWLMA